MSRIVMAPSRGVVAAMLLVVIVREGCLARGLRVATRAHTGVDADRPPESRALSLFTFGLSLAQKLADAIVGGNIDEAAQILVRTVRSGDADSVVRGLVLSQNRPGIAQTIVRALGLGLDFKELADVVESGAYENEEAADVVEKVMLLVNGSYVPAKQTAPGQYILPDGQVAQATRSPKGRSNGSPAPVAAITKTYVNGEEIRECRGRKEEQCCQQYNGALTGCLCDPGECRFQFINADPVVIMDNRRTDKRSCTCP